MLLLPLQLLRFFLDVFFGGSLAGYGLLCTFLIYARVWPFLPNPNAIDWASITSCYAVHSDMELDACKRTKKHHPHSFMSTTKEFVVGCFYSTFQLAGDYSGTAGTL